MLPRLLAPALAALVLAAAGCAPTTSSSDSAEDFQGREQQVAEAIDDLVEAARERDGRQICDSLMTPELKQALTELARRKSRTEDCAGRLRDSLTDADSFDLSVEPRGIVIRGDRATVRVKTDTRTEDQVDTLELVEQRGWRLARLAGLPAR